jgi:hypothetical protein
MDPSRAPPSSAPASGAETKEGEATSVTTIAASAPAQEAIPAVEMAPGTLFGRYIVVRPIARGGMGAVALAYDTQLERRVAIKVLLTAAEPEEARARMLREAQAMAQLSHPNVVGIYDVGTQAGDIFLAMEFVDGVPMSEWLSAQRAWPRSRARCRHRSPRLQARQRHHRSRRQGVRPGLRNRSRRTCDGSERRARARHEAPARMDARSPIVRAVAPGAAHLRS